MSQAPQQPKLTSSQEDSIKKVLFETFCQNYHALCAIINKLPIAQALMSTITGHFDTGFLWAKEAFQILSFLEQKEKAEKEAAKDQPTAVNDFLMDSEVVDAPKNPA